MLQDAEESINLSEGHECECGMAIALVAAALLVALAWLSR